MEDVLEIYHRPRNSRRPMICLDETTKQLIGEVCDPLPTAPGQVAAQDYHYVRNGVGTMFMMVAPLEGWREVRVTDTKKRTDYSHCLQWLADVAWPQAEKIILVQDNLNIHHPCSLYATFAPAEARRLLERFEFHYTPKHGSWLNMAEIELSVLQRQCLDRRMHSMEFLKNQVAAWCQNRNTSANTINWRMTTQDARIKLKRLYPSL